MSTLGKQRPQGRVVPYTRLDGGKATYDEGMADSYSNTRTMTVAPGVNWQAHLIRTQDQHWVAHTLEFTEQGPKSSCKEVTGEQASEWLTDHGYVEAVERHFDQHSAAA